MRKAIGLLLAAAAAVVVFILIFHEAEGVSSSSSPAVQSMMQQGADQVARDQVAQYMIASQAGRAMDKCVHAGIVSAAYLQAKDANNYKDWKRIEDKDCKAAGMPQ